MMLYLDKFECLLLVDVVKWLARYDVGSSSVHLQSAHSRHDYGALQIVGEKRDDYLSAFFFSRVRQRMIVTPEEPILSICT